MEKEIKVRKKRFAAFWVALVVISGFLMPIAADATELETEGTSTNLKIGDPVAEGAWVYYDTVVYTAEDENNKEYTTNSGGQNVMQYSVIFGNPATGYTFKEWIVTAVTNTSVTLEATFEAIAYEITYYNLDGDDISHSNPSRYTINTGFTLSQPSKIGHTFQGWTWGDQTTPVIEVSIAAGETGARQYTAHWETNSYKVTFMADSGTLIKEENLLYGSTITPPENPTKENYIFDGWDKSFDTVPDNDVVITAKWKGVPFTIRYDVPEGASNSQDNPATYEYGVGVASFADAEMENYEFIGWYSDDSYSTKVESIGTAEARDITLYAKFEPLPIVINKGDYTLQSGVKYQLGSGVQRVSGDSSVYASGVIFYGSGSYTFE